LGRIVFGEIGFPEAATRDRPIVGREGEFAATPAYQSPLGGLSEVGALAGDVLE
jgi:hypothetical protein